MKELQQLMGKVIENGSSALWVTAKSQNRTRKIVCPFLQDGQKAMLLFGDEITIFHKNQKFMKVRSCNKCFSAMKYLKEKEYFECYECKAKVDRSGKEV